MRDEIGNYREELDRLCLTEESKRALTESLSRRGEFPVRKRRAKGGAMRLAAAAAVICVLATAGYAAVAAAPTLRDRVFSGGEAYEQSSSFIGRSADNNGWTVTVTDCVGDDVSLYLGLELAAPEGTVLDADWYCFGTRHDYCLDFPGMKYGGTHGLRQLPDEDPSDNRLTFYIFASTIIEEAEGFNGQRVRLKLPELQTGTWNKEKMQYDYTTVCPGKWDFGTMTVSYPDSTIHIEPNQPVTTLGVEAVVTEVAVSPLSVRVRIEGGALKGHHTWTPKDAPDGWYGCTDYQEIELHFDDGTSYLVGQASSDLSGSGCSGGEPDTDEDGWLYLRRTYSRASGSDAYRRLIDVDRVVSVSVCGVEIPLRPEAET